MDTTIAAAAAAREQAMALGCWSGPIAPEPLAGGISNHNFVVEDGGRRYVVRIGGDNRAHGVYRHNELMVTRAAHACGLSPAVVHHEPGALVLDWVAGARALGEADLCAAERIPQLVAMIRRCHRDMPAHLAGPGPMFWPFAANARYLSRLRRNGCRHAGRLDGLERRNRELEAMLGPIEPVFCHNDLLAANWLDDGERLWLIDWEYGGWNTGLFDLANLASNAGYPRRARDHLLTLYFDRLADERVRRRLAIAIAVSLLRESLWSLTAEADSALNFDYVAYSDDYLARFDAAWADLQPG